MEMIAQSIVGLVSGMWTTPKTDWSNKTYFNVTPDWIRITGNIEYIQQAARPKYLDIQLEPMETLSVLDLPYANRLNSVENNLETLGRRIVNLNTFPKKEVQYANSPIWDYADLNRIEGFSLLLKDLVDKTGINVPTLAFTLGGEEFE